MGKAAPSGFRPAGDGSGIGLTIARQLMRVHGGDLVAHSAGPGQGATFVATLPPYGSSADEQVRTS